MKNVQYQIWLYKIKETGLGGSSLHLAICSQGLPFGDSLDSVKLNRKRQCLQISIFRGFTVKGIKETKHSFWEHQVIQEFSVFMFRKIWICLNTATEKIIERERVNIQDNYECATMKQNLFPRWRRRKRKLSHAWTCHRVIEIDLWF